MARPPYPSDMSDAQWAIIEPLLPKAKSGARPRTVDLREVINAVFYLNRSGCSWRMLPHDFAPWGTVHWFYRQWRLDGTWERVHEVLRPQVREQAGGEASPSAAIIDSQSVKTTEKGGLAGTMLARKSMGASAIS
jgi:putative transposase